MLEPSNNEWNCKTANIGKDTLGNLLPILTERCELSKRYTNHCVRVTTVQVLCEQGYDNDEIALVTGHKDASSVMKYCTKKT